MSGSTPGGYAVAHGLFRVPDLLTEQQFVDYMRDIYGVEVTFKYPDHKEVPVAARALGQSFNIAPGAQLDGRALHDDLDTDNVKSLLSGVDPVLAAINNQTLPAAYNTNPIGNVPAEDDDRVKVKTDSAPVDPAYTGDGEVYMEDDDGGLSDEEMANLNSDNESK